MKHFGDNVSLIWVDFFSCIACIYLSRFSPFLARFVVSRIPFIWNFSFVNGQFLTKLLVCWIICALGNTSIKTYLYRHFQRVMQPWNDSLIPFNSPVAPSVSTEWPTLQVQRDDPALCCLFIKTAVGALSLVFLTGCHISVGYCQLHL